MLNRSSSNGRSSSSSSLKSREEQLYDKIQELSLDVNTRIREVRFFFFETSSRERRFESLYFCVSLCIICTVKSVIDVVYLERKREREREFIFFSFFWIFFSIFQFFFETSSFAV